MSEINPYSSDPCGDKLLLTSQHPLMSALAQLCDLGWSLSPIMADISINGPVTHVKLKATRRSAPFSKERGESEEIVFECEKEGCTVLSGSLQWTSFYPRTDELIELGALRHHAIMMGVAKHLSTVGLAEKCGIQAMWAEADGTILTSRYCVSVDPEPGVTAARPTVYGLEPSFNLVDVWTPKFGR